MIPERLNKEEATKRILEHVEEINIRPNRSIEFIGFKDDKWISVRKTTLIIKCNIHNITFETNYKVFLKSKGCPKCRWDSIRNSVAKILDEEDAIIAINNKIQEEKKKGYDLEFLGFIGEYKAISTTCIKIRCKTHNIIGAPQMHVFLKKGYACPKCVGNLARENFQLSNKEIYDRLVEKFGDKNYDFSSILEEDELGSRSGRDITFYCKVHNKFITREIRGLFSQKGNIPCHECYIEDLRERNKQEYLKRIEEGIEYRRSLGYNIEFLGFVGEWEGCYTKLRLLCKTHRYVWETTSARGFVNQSSLIGCPECYNSLNKSETICYDIINELEIIPDLTRQHTVSIFDDKLNRDRNLRFDFYSEKLNTVIEFDGAQHFMYVHQFHRDKMGYLDQLRRDELKNKYCEENGIKLLRISYKEKKKDIGNVVKTFVETGEDISIKLTPEPFSEIT